MNRILAIETSGPRFSIALQEGSRLVDSFRAPEDLLHETKLAEEIKSLMDSAGMEVQQLTAIAAGSGPGSYSGLRIGMALASGLSLASGVPLYTAGTLENIFFQMKEIHPHAGFFLSLMVARKNEYYLGLWENGKNDPLLPPQWAVEEEINKKLSQIYLKGTIVSNLPDHPFPLQEGTIINCPAEPDAIATAAIVHQNLSSGKQGHSLPNEPDYLKPVYISGIK